VYSIQQQSIWDSYVKFMFLDLSQEEENGHFLFLGGAAGSSKGYVGLDPHNWSAVEGKIMVCFCNLHVIN